MLKELTLFHITCVTHNSRISERMIKYKVKVGTPVELSDKDEIALAKHFSEIVKNDKLNIIAYNSCKDHIHFVIACEAERLSPIIQKIKSITARKFSENKEISQLWAQKFNRKVIYKEKQLSDVIFYVNNNRLKHNLKDIPELKSVIQSMIMPFEKILEALGNEQF
ncbi:MAG: transposase [Ignavibacteria bacterium]